MFTEGQKVETKNGSHRGIVLEIDGDTVYIEQSNGVEIDFSISELQEYVSASEKKRIESAIQALKNVKNSDFRWKSINLSSQVALEKLSIIEKEHDFSEVWEQVNKLIADKSVKFEFIDLINNSQEEKNIVFADFEKCENLSIGYRINLYLFAVDLAKYEQAEANRRKLVTYAMLGNMFRNMNKGI